MAQAPRGLGRGLESLIPKSIKSDGGVPVTTIPLTSIRPNRFQPRHRFNEESLKELADSIREQGVIQPLVVTSASPSPTDSAQYELIAGERRWRASRLAGLKEVPAVVRKVTEKEQLQFSLIENLQREDLNPIEEALAFKRLMEEFTLTQEVLARTVGKGRVVVANTLRLLNLPRYLQEAVADGTISAGHARSLVSIGDGEMQKQVAEKILQEKITVRDVEKIVSDWKGALSSGQAKLAKRKEPEIRELEESLQHALGTKVEIRSKGHGATVKGTITISYFTLEDLEKIVGKLKGKEEAVGG